MNRGQLQYKGNFVIFLDMLSGWLWQKFSWKISSLSQEASRSGTKVALSLIDSLIHTVGAVIIPWRLSALFIPAMSPPSIATEEPRPPQLNVLLLLDQFTPLRHCTGFLHCVCEEKYASVCYPAPSWSFGTTSPLSLKDVQICVQQQQLLKLI